MDVLNKNGLLTQISYIKAYINNALQSIGSTAIYMSDYVKPDSTSAIDTTDTIVEAIGKLEKGLDGKQNSGSYLTTTDTAADSNKLGGTVASDYALKTDIPTIPTNISSFTNDEGYLVSSDLNGYATENYVNTAVSGLVNSAPATLDTLNELATALGNDANFATTVSTQIGTKVSTNSANYIKGASVSNNILTLTKGDDTTITFTDNNTTYFNATTSVDGLMSANDKTKLDGIEEYTGSEVNTIWLDYFNPFVTVTITQSENQTIHVLINNETDYTETFSVRTGAQYSVSVVPDTGYAAGTVSSSSGIISEAITISATEAIQTFILTLEATENQTITLTYIEPNEEAVTVTSTSTAQEIIVLYGTTWSASIEAAEGYTAGTLSDSSGTVIDDITITATAAVTSDDG